MLASTSCETTFTLCNIWALYYVTLPINIYSVLKHNVRECNKYPSAGLHLEESGCTEAEDQLHKHKQLVVYWIWLLTGLSRCKRINLKFSLETDIPLRRISLFWTYPHLVEIAAKRENSCCESEKYGVHSLITLWVSPHKMQEIQHKSVANPQHNPCIYNVGFAVDSLKISHLLNSKLCAQC